MAKKERKKFTATITRGKDKASAWLCDVKVSVYDKDKDIWWFDDEVISAWKNASAAKRSVKDAVKEFTPRKSIKFIAGEELDEKGKPFQFSGEFEFKE